MFPEGGGFGLYLVGGRGGGADTYIGIFKCNNLKKMYSL